MSFKRCPGSASFLQPKPEAVLCPDCGADVEIWSDEASGQCRGCRRIVIRTETQCCVDWCRHAEECLGSDKYRQYGEMRAAMRKPALIEDLRHALAQAAGTPRPTDHSASGPNPEEDSLEARVARATRVAVYAEMLLSQLPTADPQVVLPAAILEDLHANGCPGTRATPATVTDAACVPAVRAILANQGYSGPSLAEIEAILHDLENDQISGESSSERRIVHDAVLLAHAEGDRPEPSCKDQAEALLRRCLTAPGVKTMREVLRLS